MNRIFVPLLAAALTASVFAQGPAPGGAQGGALDSRAVKLSQLKNGALQYFEGGKYAEAIKKGEEYLGMLAADEKAREAEKVTYLLLAECYYRLGKEDNITKAIGFWNEFLRLWPVDPMVIQVRSAVAGAYMTMKQWEKAIEWWVQVEGMGRELEAAKNPDATRIYGRNMKENALDGQAFSDRQLKKPEEEIVVLERLVYPDFFTPVSAEGAVRLMSLYALKHDPADPKTAEFADKAVALLKALQLKSHLVENFIALNSIAIKLGDELLDVHAYTKALDAYWAVRSRDVVAQMQKDRIKAIEQRMTQLVAKATSAKDPIAIAQANRTNEEVIKPRLEESKKILAEFEKLPDFMPSLYFRLARCQADLNKKWEAIVVFNQILEDYPRSPVRELVIFSRLALYVDLGVAERSYTYCDEYLKEYPTGPHAAEVLYLKGIASMRKKDWYMGEKNFEFAVKQLGDLPDRTEIWARASTDPKIKSNASQLKDDAENHKKLYWTQCRYQLANARFLQNKFDVAQEDFTAFCNEFGAVAGGKGEFMEDAEYELALCHLFQGHYQKTPENPGDGAIERLTNYLAKWGVQSGYGSDAKYRLAICRFAAYESELCVKECDEWLKTYGANKDEILQPEVYSLLGDAKAALKLYDESAAAYIKSSQLATTDEVLTYSLFEAGKQLQKAGDWAGIDALYTDFVKTRPEHPAAVTAIYWMGKAKAKLGNLEDAKKITIETLQKHLANQKIEGVEMMLSQLAEWSRRRPVTKTVATADQALPKWDAEAELTNILKPLTENQNPTAQARLEYAMGELYRIGRTPEKRVAIIGAIAEKYKPEDLSPHLLMETGDFFLAQGNVERAEAAYRRLKEDFPKSERVDAGWVGLAEVQFARKDFKKAMEYYTYAIDRLGAPWKLKEALIGQAKCWLEFAALEKEKKKADDLWTKAKKQFEEVASVREWRGESTALALYYIAEVQFRQGKFPEATAAFERVTDSQGKYPRWVARSFLRAAEGYYRQGKNEVAQKTLLKLLQPRDDKGAPDSKKIEKFTGLPELDQARKRLTELGGTV